MVQPEMQQVEILMRAQAEERHPELEAALKHLLASGGKRVRPALSLLMGELLGAGRERLITLAASIELLHTATLVHDDLIDGAILRRGMATLNSQWSPAATVLTGDFIFARAAKLAAETNSVAVMRMFAETLSTMRPRDHPLSRMTTQAEYEQRIYSKTASVRAGTTSAPISPVDEEQESPFVVLADRSGWRFRLRRRA
jgi:geranylgeranyl pyrophosphate synthase